MADDTTAKGRTPGNAPGNTPGNAPLDDKPVGRARDKSTGPARPRPPFQHPSKMDVKKKDAPPDDLKRQEDDLKRQEEDEESVRKGPVE